MNLADRGVQARKSPRSLRLPAKPRYAPLVAFLALAAPFSGLAFLVPLASARPWRRGP